MKALVVVPAESGGGRLEVCDVPSPRLRSTELLVDVYASTVSRADTFVWRDPNRLVRSASSFVADDAEDDGSPNPLAGFRINGGEFAGVVVDAGPKATNFKPGDRVMGMGFGGQAEQIAIDHRIVIPVPDALDWATAASVPSVYITCHDALKTAAEVQPGESILIHSAASGVGTAAIQLARAFGAGLLLGTASTEEKLNRLPALGLDVPINYRTQDFAEVVAERTNGKGVEIILDAVGGPHLAGNIKALAIKGRMISIGKTGGAIGELNLDTLSFKRARIIGVTFRSRTFTERAAAVARMRDDVVPLLANGIIRPVVDRVYPLDDAVSAYEFMETNQNFGRVVIQTRPAS